MAEVSMLEKVKLALRINHDYLDADIQASIDTAGAEMVRSGVSSVKAADYTDNMICTAIITFCKSVYVSDNAQAERYNQSWLFQLENLRKSAGYMEGV